MRTHLSGPINYYVSTTGNNSNDGLSWTTAWADPWTNVVSQIWNAIDFCGQAVTVNIDTGTYVVPAGTSGVTLTGPNVGSGSLVFLGAGQFTVIDGYTNSVPCFTALNGAVFTVSTLAVQTQGSIGVNTAAIQSLIQSRINIGSIWFNDSPLGVHLYCNRQSYLSMVQKCLIFGGAYNHIQCSHQGNFRAYASNAEIEEFGINCNFSGAFLYCMNLADSTWSGNCTISKNGFAVTGVPYEVTENATIQVAQTPGLSGFFPGSLTPIVASGGWAGP